MRFKVISTFSMAGTAVVIVKRNGDEDFSITSRSRLDGVPLQEMLEIPHKLLLPNIDFAKNVFAFTLADASALPRFQKYDVVELTP